MSRLNRGLCRAYALKSLPLRLLTILTEVYNHVLKLDLMKPAVESHGQLWIPGVQVGKLHAQYAHTHNTHPSSRHYQHTYGKDHSYPSRERKR